MLFQTGACRDGIRRRYPSGVKNQGPDTKRFVFFLRNGIDAGINENPDEFAKWMQRVAKNLMLDYVRRQAAVSARVRAIADGEELAARQSVDPAEAEERQSLLAKAFSVVLESDSSVHIILTWIASFLFINELGVERCHVSKEIATAFEDKTLNEMRNCLIRSAERIPWLSLSEKQIEKLDKGMNQMFDSEHTCGQMKYSAFFMKSGGKSSISNWNNRMNSLVRRVIKP